MPPVNLTLVQVRQSYIQACPGQPGFAGLATCYLVSDLKFIPVDKCRHCYLCHPYCHVNGLQYGRYTGFCEFYRQVLKDVDSKPTECDLRGFKLEFEDRPTVYRDRMEFTYR